mmetsp:Transcript_5326/g.12969  ORF Transcript_5326/g.12969 Transcript_5326/m.12969 type:complete len:252 (+) Transcript_5326:1646-2401(+)
MTKPEEKLDSCCSICHGSAKFGLTSVQKTFTTDLRMPALDPIRRVAGLSTTSSGSILPLALVLHFEPDRDWLLLSSESFRSFTLLANRRCCLQGRRRGTGVVEEQHLGAKTSGKRRCGGGTPFDGEERVDPYPNGDGLAFREPNGEGARLSSARTDTSTSACPRRGSSAGATKRNPAPRRRAPSRQRDTIGYARVPPLPCSHTHERTHGHTHTHTEKGRLPGRDIANATDRRGGGLRGGGEEEPRGGGPRG